MTPYELSILMHHYVSPSPYAGEGAMLYEPAVKEFMEMGMLDTNGERLVTTPKANAWIEYILSVPFPEMKWIIPSV